MDAHSKPDLPPLIVFDRVDKRYGSRSVLSQLSFSIARNQFVLLSGPSGAGKSTVLRLIAALEQPTSGSITVAGEPLGRLKPQMLPLLRRSMGIVLQDLLLLDDRSVLHNVALPCVAAGIATLSPCEAMTTVTPATTNCSSRWMTCAAASGSRCAVGSSTSSNAG